LHESDLCKPGRPPALHPFVHCRPLQVKVVSPLALVDAAAGRAAPVVVQDYDAARGGIAGDDAAYVYVCRRPH
jgi:hypothetical protein